MLCSGHTSVSMFATTHNRHLYVYLYLYLYLYLCPIQCYVLCQYVCYQTHYRPHLWLLLDAVDTQEKQLFLYFWFSWVRRNKEGQYRIFTGLIGFFWSWTKNNSEVPYMMWKIWIVIKNNFKYTESGKSVEAFQIFF